MVPNQQLKVDEYVNIGTRILLIKSPLILPGMICAVKRAVKENLVVLGAKTGKMDEPVNGELNITRSCNFVFIFNFA